MDSEIKQKPFYSPISGFWGTILDCYSKNVRGKMRGILLYTLLFRNSCTRPPDKLTKPSPENQRVGSDFRCISFWNGPFLGDELVRFRNCIFAEFGHPKSLWHRAFILALRFKGFEGRVNSEMRWDMILILPAHRRIEFNEGTLLDKILQVTPVSGE